MAADVQRAPWGRSQMISFTRVGNDQTVKDLARRARAHQTSKLNSCAQALKLMRLMAGQVVLLADEVIQLRGQVRHG